MRPARPARWEREDWEDRKVERWERFVVGSRMTVRDMQVSMTRVIDGTVMLRRLGRRGGRGGG